MKRITIVVPDELNVRLQQERRRRDVSIAVVVREALEAYLGSSDLPDDVPFAGVDRSGRHDIATRAEEILDQAWGRLRDR